MSARVEIVLIHFIAAGIASAMILAAAWLWWPVSPAFRFIEQHAEIVVPRGQSLVFTRRFELTRPVSAHVTRQVRCGDGVEHWLEAIDQDYRAGLTEIARGSELPRDLPAGVCVYRATVHYRVNPLRTLSQEAPPVPFRLVDP